MDIDDMIENLSEYYEAAGFADTYERKLKNLSDQEIIKLYKDTFKKNDFEGLGYGQEN